MAGALRDEAGGIAGLVALLREHGEAIEADLAFRGIEDPQALSLRRLDVLVNGLLKLPDSILRRTLAKDDGWTLTDHLLALVHDQLAIANWQRASNPKRKRPKPKPISPLARRGTRMGGNHGRSDEEMKALLERYRTGQMEGHVTNQT